VLQVAVVRGRSQRSIITHEGSTLPVALAACLSRAPTLRRHRDRSGDGLSIFGQEKDRRDLFLPRLVSGQIDVSEIDIPCDEE